MKSEGICSFCKKSISGNAIRKHLESCEKRTNSEGEETIFLIKAHDGPFWIYFEANGSFSLKDIDLFLRRLWLECCGHLSAFTINSSRYFSSPEHGEKGMRAMIKDAIAKGMKFKHEYDFGTTTLLSLECISERKGAPLKKIELLARNNMPDFRCKCGKPATDVCTECLWEGNGFLCEKCAKSHECGEDMLLPVVNSPRMGMCGYTGED